MAVVLLLIIDIGPWMLALLGHSFKGLIDPLGLDPALPRAKVGAVR